MGGAFTGIGGQPRNRIAALDGTTGLATSWDPDANSAVNSIATVGSTVYVGGAFTTISGQARNRIARFAPAAAPGGAVASIPTLSAGGLVLLAGLVAAFALAVSRKGNLR
ncbi:hypothetical protein D3C72_2129790 [compost metagenome]